MYSVLLVDDEPALCEIARVFLERDGDISVTTALSGEDALSIFHAGHFDVVVADFEMPGMNGIDLLKTLNAEGSDVPLIIFTGRGREEVVIDALNNGAAHYLRKGGSPNIQFAELRHIILQVVKKNQAEKQLERRENEYLDLFEHMLNGFALHELVFDDAGTPIDYRFLAVNPSFENHTGLRADEIIGRTVREVLPDIEGTWIEDYARVAMTGVPVRFERYSRSLGRWFDVSAFSPALNQFATIIDNITERRTAESGLRSRLSALTRPAADLDEVTFPDVIDGEGVMEVQRNLFDLIGIRSMILGPDRAPVFEALERSDFCNIVSGSGAKKPFPFMDFLEDIGDSLCIKQDLCFEGTIVAAAPFIIEGQTMGYWVLCPATTAAPDPDQVRAYARSIGVDGEALIAAANALPRVSLRTFSMAAGFLASLAARFSDLGMKVLLQGRLLNELEHVEAALRDKDEMSSIIFSNVPAGVYLRDTDGKYLSVNPAYAAIVDLDEASIIGKTVYDLFDREFASVFDEADRRVILTGRRDLSVEMKARTPSGRSLWFTASRTPIHGAGGKVIGVVGLVFDITAQKKAREAVIDSEIRYREIFNNMRSGMAILTIDDGEVIVQDLNLAAERIDGIDRDKVIGRHLDQVMPMAREFGLIQAIQRVHQTGIPEHIPFVRKDRGNIVFWREGYFFRLPSDTVGVVYDDLTTIRQAELDLKTSERTYRTVIEDLQDVFLRTDFSGRLLMISPSGASLFGFSSPESMEGMNIVDRLFPDPGIWDQMVAEIRAKGSITDWEFELMTIDRRPIKVSASCHPWTDDDGVAVGVEGMIRDIRWKKKVEEELRSSKELLEGVIDAIQDVIAVQKPDHTIVRYNRAGYDLLNISPDEVAGRRCYELLGRSRICDPCATVAALKSKKIAQVERYIPEIGRYFICRSNPVVGPDGEVRLIIEQLTDITGRKRMEEALQQANKKLNILNSITRHDILNWLTALLGYIEIEKTTITDPSHLEIVGKEELAAYNIRRLITFTKEYQDIGVKAPVWQDIGGVTRSAVAHVGSKDLEVTIDLEGYEIYADPMLIRVIENLIDNSLRHGGHVHRLRFSAKQDKGDLRIIYEDDGVGIPDNEKPLLFKRGYGKNTGFGLFLSREILSITGLSMTEEGRAGEGVRFVITVPRVACREISR
ncbi:PAS domain S-box protein [Methanofollis fontis]|uniref:Histidine kinase n=1 Tax=Methanofollis fontis TaxID=2052832 RepID=A0A483CPA1_9EURY|nr:PAS domain S-box protein [Methanofollis fontis]TAJ43938.1 hypothetical protein CUJ86_07730 [Methanofollis fontis]